MKMEPSADLEKDARCSVQEILAAIDTGSGGGGGGGGGNGGDRPSSSSDTGSSSSSSSSGNSSSSMDLTTEVRGFSCLL